MLPRSLDPRFRWRISIVTFILLIGIMSTHGCNSAEDKAWEQLILARNRAGDEMRLNDALRLSEQCESYSAARFGDPSRELATARNAKGVVLSRMGNFAAADSVFSNSIQIHVQLNDTLSREYSTSLFNYGKFLRERNRPRESVLMLESVRLKLRQNPRLNPGIARLLTRELAKAKSQNGEDREARELFYELIDKYLADHDTLNADYVGALYEVGQIWWTLQQYDSAIALELRARSLASVGTLVLDEDSAAILRILSKCYWEQGDTVGAIDLMRKSLSAAVIGKRQTPYGIALITNGLSNQLMESGDLQEADSLAATVIASCPSTFYPTMAVCIRALLLKAEISQKRGDCREALRIGTEALSKCDAWAPSDFTARATCLYELASFEYECGSEQEAREHVDEAAKIASAVKHFESKTMKHILDLQARLRASAN